MPLTRSAAVALDHWLMIERRIDAAVPAAHSRKRGAVRHRGRGHGPLLSLRRLLLRLQVRPRPPCQEECAPADGSLRLWWTKHDSKERLWDPQEPILELLLTFFFDFENFLGLILLVCCRSFAYTTPWKSTPRSFSDSFVQLFGINFSQSFSDDWGISGVVFYIV